MFWNSLLLFGHGFLQNSRDEYEGLICIRYHLYNIPRNHPFNNAVVFSYGSSFYWLKDADGRRNYTSKLKRKTVKLTVTVTVKLAVIVAVTVGVTVQVEAKTA